VLRKSKPECINVSLGRNLTLAALTVALALVSVGSAGARVGAARAVRVSTDTLTTPVAQHATEVEPDAAASGSTIVSVFQVGRFFDGGAAAIGFAISTNAGRTWRSGLLPALTASTTPPGPAARATDPAVAFDAAHHRWLAASLTISADSSSVVVSASSDGAAWDAPVTAISHPRPERNPEETNLDKSWLTCDNGATSPFRGRCYVAYTDFAQPGVNIGVQSSDDGGLTWSAPAFVLVSVDVPGVQPVVRPNGQLVLVFRNGPGRLEAVRSGDGGRTFSQQHELIAQPRTHQRRQSPTVLRVFALPTAAVDAGGTIYIAWSDCRFRRVCAANDIVVSHSTGAGWTVPRRVPVRGLGPTADHVLPGLGVDPRSRGTRARLALTFYTLRSAGCASSQCLLDVRMATSPNGGARWSAAPRLNARAMRLAWLPRTSSGFMVGDYVASEFAGNRAVGVFAIAFPPRSGRLDDAIHAAVRTVAVAP